MSIPRRAADGCIVATSLNHKTYFPHGHGRGKFSVKAVSKCPDHPVLRRETEIRCGGKVVGHWVEHLYCAPNPGHMIGSHVIEAPADAGWNPGHIEVCHSKAVRHFPDHDVFCRDKKEWSFHDQRR